MSIRYFEDTNDATRTSIYIDYVVLEERYVSSGGGNPYANLAAFMAAAKTEIYYFIDYTMPPSDSDIEVWMTGWLGDWIDSRKCEATDYGVYSGNPTTDAHYGSKELVDMATELVYSGWVYALGIEDDVSADRVTWQQWWSRGHRTPGVSYY